MNWQVRNDFLQLMMKSLKTNGDAETKKVSATSPEADQYAEDNQGADIISEVLSVGAGNEKPKSHDPNYKLSMEVCFKFD
jgi:hypothetical protein